MKKEKQTKKYTHTNKKKHFSKTPMLGCKS